MAGAPGFEPGIAGPKPAALPLGYAPLRREYRRGPGPRRAPRACRARRRAERALRSRRARPTPNASHLTCCRAIGTRTARACDAAKIQEMWRAARTVYVAAHRDVPGERRDREDVDASTCRTLPESRRAPSIAPIQSARRTCARGDTGRARPGVFEHASASAAIAGKTTTQGP